MESSWLNLYMFLSKIIIFFFLYFTEIFKCYLGLINFFPPRLIFVNGYFRDLIWLKIALASVRHKTTLVSWLNHATSQRKIFLKNTEILLATNKTLKNNSKTMLIVVFRFCLYLGWSESLACMIVTYLILLRDKCDQEWSWFKRY